MGLEVAEGLVRGKFALNANCKYSLLHTEAPIDRMLSCTVQTHHIGGEALIIGMHGTVHGSLWVRCSLQLLFKRCLEACVLNRTRGDKADGANPARRQPHASLNMCPACTQPVQTSPINAAYHTLQLMLMLHPHSNAT